MQNARLQCPSRQCAMHRVDGWQWQKCTVCSFWPPPNGHPTKCPSLHFPILGTDSHVKQLQKVGEENLEETTPMPKILTPANCSKFQAHRRRLVCRCLPRGVASNSHGVRIKKCTCALKNWDRNVQQKNVHTAMFLLLTFAACYCFWPKHERSQIMCQLCGSGEDKRWKTTN